MYALPRTNYLKRSFIVNNQKPNPQSFAVSHSEAIKRQLLSLGVSRFAMHSMEARYLPHIIYPDEKIEGIVYGKGEDGLVMLIATNRRAIFLDKKPLFVNEDELTYDVVSGVNHSSTGMGSKVILHTRVKDYAVQTFNEKCALGFVAAIEKRCIEQRLKDGYRRDYYA